MTGADYKDLILYNVDKTSDRISDITNGIYHEVTEGFIVIAVLITLLTSWDFSKIIRNYLLSFVIIGTFHWFYTGAANIGFDIGATILSNSNKVVKQMGEASNSAQLGFKIIKLEADDPDQKSLFESLKFVSLGTDAASIIHWVLSAVALWFIKVTFTLVYYLPYCLVGISCIISLLPMTNKTLDGVLMTTMWVAVTPIVLAAVIELCSSVMYGPAMGGTSIATSILARLIMSVVFALYLLLSFGISYALVSGGTMSDAVARAGSSFGTGAVLLGGQLIKKAATMGAGTIASKGMSSLINSKARHFASAGAQLKSKPLSAQDIAGGKSFKESMTNYEQKLSKQNSFANPIKAHREKRDIEGAAKMMVDENRGDSPVTRSEVNRFRIRSGKSPIDEYTGKKIKTFNKNKYFRPDDPEMKTLIKGQSFRGIKQQPLENAKGRELASSTPVKKSIKPLQIKNSSTRVTKHSKNKELPQTFKSAPKQKRKGRIHRENRP